MSQPKIVDRINLRASSSSSSKAVLSLKTWLQHQAIEVQQTYMKAEFHTCAQSWQRNNQATEHSTTRLEVKECFR